MRVFARSTKVFFMAATIDEVLKKYLSIDTAGDGHCEAKTRETSVTPCGAVIKKARPGNFKRHFTRVHLDLFKELEKQCNERRTLLKSLEKTNRSILDFAKPANEGQGVNVAAAPAPTEAPVTTQAPATTKASATREIEETPSCSRDNNYSPIQEESEDIFTPRTRKRRKNSEQRSMIEFVEQDRIVVYLTKAQVLRAIVELVTVNGRPFTIVDDSGFRILLDALLTALPGKMTISAEKVPHLIAEEALSVQTEIKHLFQKRMFSLKIDIVTRLERGYLGVNVQTVENGKIIIRCLGCEYLESAHTSLNVKNKIISLLEKYNFSLGQIYSITYDNGRNMVRAGELLSTEAADILMEALVSEDLHTNEGRDNAAELDEINQLDSKNEETLKSALETMATLCVVYNDSVQLGINDLRCVAHTLQLVVIDAFGKDLADTTFDDEATLLVKVRSLQKYLRTTLVRYEIDKYNYENPLTKMKVPIIDILTRWMSTYDMLQSCLDSRLFCESDHFAQVDKQNSKKPVVLTNNEYEEVEDMVKTLRPLKIATLKFQEEQLTIPDMVLVWQRAKLKVRQINSTLAQVLVAEMNKRETIIFSQMGVLCALYLDPRAYLYVPFEKVKSVQEHLLFLGNRLQKLKFDSEIVREAESAEHQLSDENGEENTLEMELRKLKKERQRKKQMDGISSGPTCISSSYIEQEIKSFQEPPNLGLSESILDFWEENKQIYPALYELARVVLAAPATQVSVERLFSGLKFILPPLRNKMKPETVNNVMLVRANKMFFEKDCL